jgi:DNA mismatch repair protein MutL
LSDIIHLLPDRIANQIAAGEVIQRPASAVKELLENAVDAGADEIRLVVNDAGKSLVQVIDNGKGMSGTDARMSFERHATSKISQIDDLFQIRTMGFRGEALASIAAVAQVEMKTRRPDEELGTYLEIENSLVRQQEPCACPTGTSISMKNLFFNVPARRNFLKSNAAEMRHIVDEFIHVALAFPGIFFSLTSNGQEVFHLEKGNLKQRIVQVLGSQYAAKLVGVREHTDYLNIEGFVGKPDAARKTRGDQYFIVNNRYIRSGYLHHAVMNAFQDMIPADSFPLYVLCIDIDPAQLDINVHPTKQEIKFEDEKIVYAFVQAAVKHALAQYSVTPTLDFELDAGIQSLDAVNKPFSSEIRETAQGSPLFRTFTQQHQAHFIEADKKPLPDWSRNRDPQTSPTPWPGSPGQMPVSTSWPTRSAEPEQTPLDISDNGWLVQLHNTFILAPHARGMVMVHQQIAHERILYERMKEAMSGQAVAVQRSLFPATLEMPPSDAVLLQSLLPDLVQLGYQVEAFGGNSFVIQGSPIDADDADAARTIENLLEQFKHFNPDLRFSSREKLMRALARQRAVKAGRPLSEKEMRKLIAELATCGSSNLGIDGQPAYLDFKQEHFFRMFGSL